ncbi:MAG: hypothetical protein K2Q12_02610 [Rickettsiales bacterium]|nr:hypothetical protein [Rickettsiales bacterium]
MRVNTMIGMMVVLVLILGVTRVKYVVGDVRRDVTQLEHQLAQEQIKIHVLQAEWAHLNRPERLQALGEQHLALVPVSVTSLREVYTIPVRGESSQMVNTAPMATEVRYAR